jgi:hypothetical protein
VPRGKETTIMYEKRRNISEQPMEQDEEPISAPLDDDENLDEDEDPEDEA